MDNEFNDIKYFTHESLIIYNILQISFFPITIFYVLYRIFDGIFSFIIVILFIFLIILLVVILLMIKKFKIDLINNKYKIIINDNSIKIIDNSEKVKDSLNFSDIRKIKIKKEKSIIIIKHNLKKILLKNYNNDFLLIIKEFSKSNNIEISQ